jgi:uncharacterized membrane protein YgdD (TMEM256/DUF423 family)
MPWSLHPRKENASLPVVRSVLSTVIVVDNEEREPAVASTGAELDIIHSIAFLVLVLLQVHILGQVGID